MHLDSRCPARCLGHSVCSVNKHTGEVRMSPGLFHDFRSDPPMLYDSHCVPPWKAVGCVGPGCSQSRHCAGHTVAVPSKLRKLTFCMVDIFLQLKANFHPRPRKLLGVLLPSYTWESAFEQEGSLAVKGYKLSCGVAIHGGFWPDFVVVAVYVRQSV